MNNRSLTLDGANKIFEVLDIQIEHDPLGFYKAAYRETVYQARTLTELCQTLIVSIASP
jgi:hypothetical protein